MDNTYPVVAFEEENAVDLVPANWLKAKDKTYWPPFKSTVAITKAVQSRQAPDTNTWKVCKIHVIRACRKSVNHVHCLPTL